MPDSILDLDAFNAGFSQSAQVAQQRHDATGTGARMGANLKEGLWNLQAAGAGLVGADEARQEALASQRLSQDLRGAAADTAGEQAIGAAIESSPMTLASFLPAAVLRIPAARLAAGRTLQAATARGLSAAEAQMLARMAGEKAANVAARAGMAGGMGALSAPDAYDQAKTAGASDGTALANAIGSAFTEGAFTFMSPGGVESAMLTRPALTGGLGRVLAQGGRRLAGGVVGEAGEEVATEGAHILREQGLGINPGTLFDPANLERLGLSAAAGGLMGGGFTAPGVAVDAARQVPGAVAPAVLAARLRLAQPEVAPQAQPEAPPAPMAPDGPSYADLTEQTLAAEAVRRGLPQDFTPLPPEPQGPAGQGFAGYAEAQPDPVAALAALFQAAQAAEPPVSGMIAPEVPNAPPAAPPAALVAPGPVPGGAPARAPAPAAAPPPAPVAPQPAAPPAKAVGRAKTPKPAAAPAPTGQPAAAPSMPTPVPPPAAAVPAVAPAGDQPGTGFRVGQRVRWTKGKKQGVEATVTALTNGRPVLRTDDGKTIGAAGGITPENLEAIADAPAAPNPGAAPLAPPRPGPAAAAPPAAQPQAPRKSLPGKAGIIQRNNPPAEITPEATDVRPAPAPPTPEPAATPQPAVDAGHERVPGPAAAAPGPVGNGPPGPASGSAEPAPAPVPPAPQSDRAPAVVPPSPVNTGEKAPTTGEKAPPAPSSTAQRWGESWGKSRMEWMQRAGMKGPKLEKLATRTWGQLPDSIRKRLESAAPEPVREEAGIPIPSPARGKRYSRKEWLSLGFKVVRDSPAYKALEVRAIEIQKRIAKLGPMRSGRPAGEQFLGGSFTGKPSPLSLVQELPRLFSGRMDRSDWDGSTWKQMPVVPDDQLTEESLREMVQRHAIPQMEKVRRQLDQLDDPKLWSEKTDPQYVVDSIASDYELRPAARWILWHIHDINVRDDRPRSGDDRPTLSDLADKTATVADWKAADAKADAESKARDITDAKEHKAAVLEVVAYLSELAKQGKGITHAPTLTRYMREKFGKGAGMDHGVFRGRGGKWVAHIERSNDPEDHLIALVQEYQRIKDIDPEQEPDQLRHGSVYESARKVLRARLGGANAKDILRNPDAPVPALAPVPPDQLPPRLHALRDAMREYIAAVTSFEDALVQMKQQGAKLGFGNQAWGGDRIDYKNLGDALDRSGYDNLPQLWQALGGKPAVNEEEAAPATPSPETGGDIAPRAPEQPAPEAAANNPEHLPAVGTRVRVAREGDAEWTGTVVSHIDQARAMVKPDDAQAVPVSMRPRRGRDVGVHARFLSVEPKTDVQTEAKPGPAAELRTADAEERMRRIADPRAVQSITESLYRLVNAVGDPGSEVVVKKLDDTPEFRLSISGPVGEATTAYTTDEAMREAGVELGALGRFQFDALTKHLEQINNAITGRNIKAGTVGKVKRGELPRPLDAGVKNEKLAKDIPDAPAQKAYSQREEDARPAIIDLEAINKDMKIGRVVAVPGGWRFTAPGGRGIGIRSATAEEARANEGRAEGYFTGVDALTGEPQIVLIPGRTGAFTVNHELVHHARRLGVLTDAHLEALARIGAKHGIAAKWGKAYREAKPDITATELREEIAAKTVEAIKAGEIPLKPGFVQRFLDWVADLARAAAGLPASDRRLARDVVEGRVFEGGQESAAAAPAAGEQVFSLADDGEPEKRTPEERLAEARQGVKPGDKPNTDPTMLEEFRRHFRHLDPAKHAEAIAIIRELEARLDAAGGQAERIILGHVDGLNREQAEAFNDRLVLEDILRQIEGGEFDGGPTEDGRTAAQIGEQIRADITKAIERGGEPAAQAYERRRTFQERHTRALVDADLLPAEALDDPRYYHRQVLAHLGEKQSMGLGGSEVRNRTRGFQRGRSGGTAADIPFYGDEEARRDFNANYAQAEFEYLAQSVQELARADALERLEARYNQMRAAKAEAKARNRAAMDERWAKENTVAETGERDEEAIAEGWDKHWRGLIAMNQSSLADLAMVDSFGGPYDDVWQALGEARAKWHGENDDLEPRDRMPFVFDHQAWWKALAWLAAHPDVKVWREDSRGRGSESTPAIHALAIFKAVAGREEHVRETLGNEYQTWQDVAKDMNGMVRWQPEEGLQLVPGWAATDQAITNALRKAGVDDATVAEALPPTAPVGQALKRGLIVMGKKPEWLIPEALARQLNDMRRVPDLNALGRIAETWSRRWKLWMLHQPMRVLKYQLNNLVGDLDVALTQPAIIKEVARERMQVARDLWAYTHGQALDPKTEAQMRRAQQMGLFDSGVSAAELPDVDKLPALKALFGQGWDKSWAGIPEVARRYFDSAQRFGRWREAIMRVSAARHFYREVSPQRRRYVASRKDELDQLYDRWSGLQDGIGAIYKRSNPTDADLARAEEMKREEADIHATIAAKLARELLGDYGNLSHAGQKLRRFLIPFWSWAEINAPRYVRMIKNARYEGGGGTGQALGASAAMVGGVAVRAAALSGVVFAYNAMMKAALGIGDDDDPNKEADMSKLMIIVYKDGDGKVHGLRVAGALADALGWLDLDNAWKHAKDLAIGYREGKLAQAGMDVAGDMLSAPANRIAQGLSPIIKVPIEQMAGRTFFPNAFNPRPLADRWGHLADALGVGPAYRSATDRAGVGDAAKGMLLATHDPSGAAAGRVREDAEAWAQRNGKTINAGGGVPKDQRAALAQAKAAHVRGEEARAARWLRRYFELGGKPGYLGSSKASMHPLSVILKKDRAAYLKSLDPARRADYDKAVRRWRDLWENDDGMTALAGRVWRERKTEP